MTNSVKITLTKPIQAHGQEVKELTLRPPTGGDIRRCGMPYRLVSKTDGGNATEFDTDVVAKYVVALAGVPAPSVDALTPTDFQSCINEVMNFFMPSVPDAPSIDTGN
jgi:hypothetical protein